MKNVPGIFRYKNGYYRVRVTRDKVTYYVGMYNDFDDAQDARNEFLAKLSPEVRDRIIKKYTKEWFEDEGKKQAAKFDNLYNTQGEVDPKRQAIIIRIPRTASIDFFDNRDFPR